MGSDNKAFRDEIARLIAQNNKLGDIVQGMRGEFKEMRADHAEREAQLEAEMARLEAENRELKEMIFGSGLPGETGGPPDGGPSTSLADRLSDGSATPEDIRRASGVIRGYAAKDQQRQDEVKKAEETRDAAVRQLRKYEGPNVPSSRKYKKNTPDKDRKKSGRKNGHPGVSTGIRGTGESRKAKKCLCCGSKNLTYQYAGVKMLTDMPPRPRPRTRRIVVYDSTCKKCGMTSTGIMPGLKGTSFGPHILAMVLHLWRTGASLEGMREILTDRLGMRVGRSAVFKALTALARALTPRWHEIIRMIKKTGRCNMDETTIRINGKGGYVWVYCSGKLVAFDVAHLRAADIPMRLFPPEEGIIIICDGYSGYSKYKVKQRCWAHLLREAKEVAGSSPEAERLHQVLRKVFSEARDLKESGTWGEAAGPAAAAFADRVAGVVAAYERLGVEFATKLKNAQPHLFTFLRFKDVEPTNNAAELAIKAAVRQRRCREQLKSVGGMELFSVLLSCLETWKRQKTSIEEGIASVIIG